MIEKLKIEFAKEFNSGEQIEVFFAPGRINLIGEHIDYNGGNVFPLAINTGTYAAAVKRNDNIIRLRSLNYSAKIDIQTNNIDFDKTHDWANYPKGVIKMFENAGYKINSGLDIMFYGDLPSGAGLSSSASIEMVTAVMLNHFYQFNIDMIEMVKLARKAENEYMKLNSGIMDQFAIGKGKKDFALLLNTETLQYEYVPLTLNNYCIVIANSNKKRSLVDSKYNERFAECREALNIFKQKIKIENLCEISPEIFEKNKNMIPDKVIQQRAKHAIYENQRTKLAVDALKKGKLKNFGELLIESHNSLKNDFEVTGFELDSLVQNALKQDGVVGARMTGAGFGGCTINIVEKKHVEKFIEQTAKAYTNDTKLHADFYIVESSEGARKIN